MRKLASHVSFWTVRSARDAERLERYGVACDRVAVAADLAWLLSPATGQFGERVLSQLGISATERLVGINVNNEPAMLESQPQLFEEIAAAADKLVDRHGVRILFLCSEVREGEMFDKAAASKVIALMRRSARAAIVPNRYWLPDEFSSILSRCSAVLTSRYHVCLAATLQSVPFLAVFRSDKVRDICGDMDWPYGVELSDMRAELLVERLNTLLSAENLRDELAVVANRQRERSFVNRIALAHIGVQVDSA
jgi:polysaccharide pyruvyl transferase WcaK-like protein